MANLGTLLYQIGADLTELRKAQDEVNKAAKKMKEDLDKANQAAESMNKVFGFMKTAVAAIGVAAFARDLLQTAMSLDTMNNKLRYSVGSAQAASNSYKMIRSESDRLGLNVMTAADAFGSFAVAAKDTSLEGGPVKEVFLAIAEASTVMGLSNEQASGAMLAMSQIMSKGKVQAEELRGQLGERIPGAFQIAARAMNMTTAELDKFMADGKLTANDFLPKFAAQLRKEMSGSVSEAAQSTRANLNRLENAWLDLKKSMIDAGFLDPVIAAMKGLTEAAKASAEAIKTAEEAKRRYDISMDPMGLGAGIRPFKEPPKKGSLNTASYSAYNDFSAAESAFAQGQADLAKMAEDNLGKIKTKATELRKEAISSLEAYNTKLREIRETQDAGFISAEQAQILAAKAWKEYAENYPTENIQNQIKMNQELSKAKLEQLEQERNATEFNFQMGQMGGQAYAATMNRIYDQMAAHRIATLQAEKAQTQKMMGIEAGDPTKSWMEKDLAQSKYTAQLQNIDNEIASIQTKRQQQAQQLYLEQIANTEALTNLEVNALKTILDKSSMTFQQRLVLAEQYQQKMTQLLQLQMSSNLRGGMSKDLATQLDTALYQDLDREIKSSFASQQATLFQLNSQYAQINGTLGEQLKTQRALNTANAERNAVDAKLPEIAEMYRKIAQEQNKLLDLRQSGTWGQGFAYEMDKVGKNLPTAFDEGRESVNQLKKAIDDASGSLADMFVGRKVDASQFFQQLIRDMIKVQIQGMLMKSVFGEGSGGSGFLGSILGGVGSILGGLFGGGSAGFNAIGGEMAYPNALADGGEATAGHLYRINELGTEWFRPKVSGTVIPISADASSKRGGGIGGGDFEFKPSFKVEVINNGSPVNATEGPTRQEGETWIKTVHLSALKNDEEYRAANQSLMSSGRR